jgi:hypothetical protein
MKKLIGLAVLATALAAAGVEAQESPVATPGGALEELRDVIERSGVATRMDSIASRAAPELEQALEGLTATLGVIAGRIATDPELRASAFRAAEGMIGLAQAMVAEQSEAIVEALRAAADRIATTPLEPDPPAPTP